MEVILRHELSKGVRIKSICYIQQILKFLLFLPCGLKEKTVRISMKMKCFKHDLKIAIFE